MIAYKRLKQGDEATFVQLIHLFAEVFEHETTPSPNAKRLADLLEQPGFISFVAIDNDEILGGLTAYELPSYYSQQSEVYIYDLAVATRFQRMGIGKQLIAALTEYCKQHNIKTMFVQAHEEDKGAVDFYHKAGGQAEQVVHFNFVVSE